MNHAAETPSLGYGTLHFAAALGIAVVAGGFAFFLIGVIFSYAVGGGAAIDSTIEGILGSLLFGIVLVGLFGGMPGMLVGLVMMQFRVRSLAAFIGAGVFVSGIAPIAVMALTPLGVDAWSMLLLAIPSGGIAAAAAWHYLRRYTTLLAP